MLPSGVERHRFDVTEYHKMLEAGLLTEDDRVELIRGEIVDMAPIRARHLACVTNLNRILVEQARGRCFLGVQNPVGAVDDSEPQPDFSLLRKLLDPEAGDPPPKEDALVVIEVSDTTHSYDRDVKLPLYAETGTPEAVDNRSQEPQDRGLYEARVRRLPGDEDLRGRGKGRLAGDRGYICCSGRGAWLKHRAGWPCRGIARRPRA